MIALCIVLRFDLTLSIVYFFARPSSRNTFDYRISQLLCHFTSWSLVVWLDCFALCQRSFASHFSESYAECCAACVADPYFLRMIQKRPSSRHRFSCRPRFGIMPTTNCYAQAVQLLSGTQVFKERSPEIGKDRNMI